MPTRKCQHGPLNPNTRHGDIQHGPTRFNTRPASPKHGPPNRNTPHAGTKPGPSHRARNTVEHGPHQHDTHHH